MGKRIIKIESPIEKKFIDALLSKLREDVDLECQKVFSDKDGARRVDMLLSRNGYSAIVECDGRDFHEFRADQLRDYKLMLGFNINSVLRFKGGDLFFNAPGCILHAECFLPHFFSDRNPLSDDELWEMREYPLLDHCELQPIFRCVTTKGFLQIKSAYWSWKTEGIKYWHISDLMNMTVNEIRNEPN